MTADPLRSMVGALVKSDLATHPNVPVVLSYFVLLPRYWQFFELYPQFMGSALSALMDKHGLGHPHAAVRSRACKMLYKLVKFFPASTRAHMKPILEGAVRLLSAIVTPAFDVVRSVPKT